MTARAASQARARQRPSRWRVSAFALAFAVAALVLLARAWAGMAPYREIITAAGVERATFTLADGVTWTVDRNVLVTLHERTAAYVLGAAPALPDGPAPPDGSRPLPLFTDAERSHMADVRGVFGGATLAATIALVAVLVLVVRARRTGSLALLARNGAIAAAAGVAIVAAFAAVSFDAAFLLFHQVLFPQGNFLFASDSSLLQLYPERYWYGITLRIAGSFLALCAAVAALAQLALRSGSAR